jgi:dipeptidyl aminopeptidase/acylaminoacyl peptidase
VSVEIEERAYGTWESPVTPELLAKGGARLAFPEVLPGGELSWVESRPSEGGRTVVVRRDAHGVARDELPPPRGARSRVHEYGGRAHVTIGAVTWFVGGAEQGLFRAEGGEASPVGEPSGFRLAELTPDARRGRLLAVGELHGAGGEPENGLVAVSLDDGSVAWLARGHDFYAAPALSPDGARLAFLAWDHPHMPWDAAALFVADVRDDGSLGPARVVCGGPSGSVFQPIWSPAGELYCALEVGERWSLHRVREGRAELVVDAGVELGAPLWNLGTRLFGFVDARTVVGAGLWAGRSRVVRVDVETRRVEAVACSASHIGELACRGDRALVLAGWAGGGSRLLELDLATGREAVVRDVLEGVIDPAFASRPRAIDYPTTGGATAHANLYPPHHPRFRGPVGARPPVVVVVHGGPTGCANTETQLAIQLFTTRGFAVLDVNYRGSTGFGRAYREALRGRWGVVDVDDCVAGVRHLAAEGLVDPERAIIRGSSAGGYTVLRALTEHDVFRAAACLYGPSDPRTFVAETHKLESHYEAFLFGEGEARDRALVERAPVLGTDRVRAPVIFFHGLDDAAVVASQTERVHEALRARGVDTEHHAYAGEGHGFRKAATIADVWAKELAFYRRVLRL